MSETVGYRFAGDIEIENFVLISTDGRSIDITSIVTETSIFQDIFSHYLQAEISISDSLSILDSIGGFTGGELIAISYKTKDKQLEFVSHFFGVHEITDRQRLDEKSETYVLNCISIESYLSCAKKVSRSYGTSGGNIISSMAKSVIDEFIYNADAKDFYRSYKNVLGLTVSKEVTVDPTNGLQKIIVPNMSVDDTLELFASESDSDTHIPYYVFYEDSKGYNFRDINNLVKEEPVDTFTYLMSNTDDEDDESETAVRDYQKIISYNVLKQTDYLVNSVYGLFKSKMINLDILKKRKKEFVYEYDTFESKFSKLQSQKILGQVQGDSTVYMMQTREGHDCNCSVFGDENHLPKKINKFLNVKKSYERHIFNTVLEVSLYGNSELNVGNVIELSIPNSTTLKKSDNRQDKYLSGKYIITKIRHKFGGKTGQPYTTIIECAKDTGIE